MQSSKVVLVRQFVDHALALVHIADLTAKASHGVHVR